MLPGDAARRVGSFYLVAATRHLDHIIVVFVKNIVIQKGPNPFPRDDLYDYSAGVLSPCPHITQKLELNHKNTDDSSYQETEMEECNKYKWRNISDCCVLEQEDFESQIPGV